MMLLYFSKKCECGNKLVGTVFDGSSVELTCIKCKKVYKFCISKTLTKVLSYLKEEGE